MPILLVFNTATVHPPDKPATDAQKVLHFPLPFVARPRLPHGLSKLDIGKNANIRVKSTHSATKDWVDCQITAWSDTTMIHGAIADIFVLPPANMQYLTGEHMRKRNAPASVRVNFERPFITPPKVVVFFNHIDLDKDYTWHLKTSATDIGANGFTLNIETGGNTILYGAQACWIAYPEDEPHIFSTSVSTKEVRPWHKPHLQQKTSRKITFNKIEFLKDPTVFVALNSFDVDSHANLRINAYVNDVSRTGLVWNIDTWLNTTLYSAEASIIAFTG